MGRVSAGDEIAGRYRLVQPLGSGGQGEVWEATSLSVSTLRVALKRVHQEDDGARRALEEAEKLARVRHANVVSVHDVVADGDDHWIVMGYVAGESLGQLGKITVEDAAAYGAQLADGLIAVHAQDLLHRDVTPANVIVADGVATLIDFGIAHSVADADTATSGARVTGTPGYLAPEMLVPDTQYRRPADVFGLGATLYRALEGTSPFGEGSDAQLFARTERDDVRPPRRAGAMSGVLMRMLDKNPRGRPALEAVRDELRSIAGGNGPLPPPPGPKGGRRTRVLVAAACAAVLVVAGALYSWNAFGPPSDGPDQAEGTEAPAAGPSRTGLDAQPKSTPQDEATATPEATEPEPTPTPTPDENTGGSDGGGNDGGEPPVVAAPIQFPDKSADAAREASWDPCKLLGGGALDRFGTSRTDSDRDVFQMCTVTVSNGSSLSEVELTMFTGEDPDGSGSDQGGGVTLYSSDGGAECSRDVVFGAGDRYTLSFEATQVEGSGADLCGMAQSVADRAVSLVKADEIPVRTALPLPGSVITRSTCPLPSDDALRTALLVDDLVGPGREFAEWDCNWDGDEGRYLRIMFQRDEGYAPGESTEHSLSGYTAYERGDAWEEGCLVDVVAQEGASPEGDGTVTELLRVHLTGESDQDTLCDAAVAVARSAAAAL